MTRVMDKDIEYYLSLNYTLIINHIVDEGGSYYYGRISELDGCQTTADTLEELVKDIEEVKKDHLEIKLEHGDPIPEPRDIPSGNLMLRMPKTLHWRLAGEAEREGVSLNQYIIYKLSSQK